MPDISIKAMWTDMKKLAREPVLALVAAADCLLAVCFVIWPVVKVVGLPQMAEYARLFTNIRWLHAALNSLQMVVLSTISCTMVAFLFAYTIARLDVPLKGLFRFITLLPVVSPPFIVALSYILLFGRQGIISRKLLHANFDIYGWHGLWLVQTITFFPFAYAVIYGVVQSTAIHLEYAAHNLGATRWQAFRQVFLPLCRPGIAGGALIAAMNILADFGNPMIIGGNFTTLPTEAYMQMSGLFDLPAAAMLSTALLAPALVLFFMNRIWVGQRSYISVTGRESSLRAYPAHGAVKWILFALCLFVSAVVLSVYGVLAYGAFTKTWGYDWSFTLENLKYVQSKGREIFNSISYALYSSIGASVLGIIMAYLVQRRRIGINRLLDFLAILPGAVPGVFLGLGYAIAFNSSPLEMGGTSAIMILALTFWNLPTCYSACYAGFQQIGRSLEDASLNLGADSLGTLRRVLLPLLKGPLLSALSLSFLRSVTCLSVIIFIYSVHTSVGTVSILNLVQNGNWGGASALTILLISIAFAAHGLTKLISLAMDRRKP